MPHRRANAAFVMLVRNKDLQGARRTIRQIEDRFNREYQYPYVFLNDEDFTLDFKEMMRPMSSADMRFEAIPKEHWSYPEWISEERATQARRKMSMERVLYGGSESYRHMCRYQSGFLVHHEAMREYEYFWRIEPDVKYSCDVDFDPFVYMQDNNKKYGFVVSLYEYPNTIPSLWNATKEFMTQHTHLLSSNNALDFISDDGGESYNFCHFWSNFEIVDAGWMRSEPYQQFFEHLDRTGGFFYERWGDAPVHSIAAALLLPLQELHFFKEIGYSHAPYQNCPAEPELQAKCHCDPAHNISKVHLPNTSPCHESSAFPENLSLNSITKTTMASTAVETPSQEELLEKAYVDILLVPFEEKYDEAWEEDTYWAAVEVFKAKSKEIGYEDPFEVLSKYKLTSFDDIRDKRKAGPPACFREGWISPLVGTKLDTVAAIAPLEHVNGREYSGAEPIVVLDFWATWCYPCVLAGPELSELSEKHAGRVAIVGVNNESMFREREHNAAEVKSFLTENKDGFRYTVYVDTPEGHARESVYKKTEYKAIPCVIVVVNGTVTFVGPPQEAFKAALEKALVEVPAKEE
ncbi:alpha 1,2-mannosyltransferase 2.4.1 [Mortierella alpina]|nr:alpha 1,2-mannosyltransferase 2.4.1 [Mortierella alpina]